MKYFSFDMEEGEAREIFAKLSKRLHPDKGGDKKDFAEMKCEYDDYNAIRRHFDEIQNIIDYNVRIRLENAKAQATTPQVNIGFNPLEMLNNINNIVTNISQGSEKINNIIDKINI